MRVLFVNNAFPASFRHLATALEQDSAHEAAFIANHIQDEPPAMARLSFFPRASPRPLTHPASREIESFILNGRAVFEAACELQAAGFSPDLVVGHIGWGVSLFLKDAFPDVPLLLQSAWYYRPDSPVLAFDPFGPPDVEQRLAYRLLKAPFLLAMEQADWGFAPTAWQLAQFPRWYQQQTTVIHDGIDTDFFRPQPGARLVLPERGLDLSGVDELVTYVTRGLEPYRGFDQFLAAVALIQRRRPRCHVAIVGADTMHYSPPFPHDMPYREFLLQRTPLDLSRVHFLGTLPQRDVLKVYQASAAHVYLTYPFYISWSPLEAMAAGCLLIGSATAPVTEFVRDGDNGLLVDFFAPEQIADRVDEALEQPERMQAIRARARATIVERYALADLLPRQLRLLADVAAGRLPPAC